MVAKTIPGYFGRLTNILEPTDLSLPVGDLISLSDRLNEGDFTTLLIQDQTGYEVVKALKFQNNIAIERGLNGTRPRRFPVGSCVTFAPSDELLKAFVCETDCCGSGVDKTFGEVVPSVNSVELEVSPNTVIGGVDAVLGKPAGFMSWNGKKIPFYE